jgi:hypothetical protein
MKTLLTRLTSILLLAAIVCGQPTPTCLQLSPGVSNNPNFYPCGILDPLGAPNPVTTYVPPCTIGPMWCQEPHPTFGPYGTAEVGGPQPWLRNTLTFHLSLNLNACQLLNGLYSPLHGPSYVFVYMRGVNAPSVPMLPSVFGTYMADNPILEFEIPHVPGTNQSYWSPVGVSGDVMTHAKVWYQASFAFSWMLGNSYQVQYLWFVPNQGINDWVGFYTMLETVDFPL